MGNTIYVAGVAGGVGLLTLAAIVAVLHRRRQQAYDDHRYEPILSPEEDQYDAYA